MFLGMGILTLNAFLSTKYALLLTINMWIMTPLAIILTLGFYVMVIFYTGKDRQIFNTIKGNKENPTKEIDLWIPIRNVKLMAVLYAANALAASAIWYYIGLSPYMAAICFLVWLPGTNIHFEQDRLFKKYGKQITMKDMKQ